MRHETFNEIERLYPFSQLAKRAITMSAFASYSCRRFCQPRGRRRGAISTCIPPTGTRPYAQHLIALSYYDNGSSMSVATRRTTQRALTGVCAKLSAAIPIAISPATPS